MIYFVCCFCVVCYVCLFVMMIVVLFVCVLVVLFVGWYEIVNYIGMIGNVLVYVLLQIYDVINYNDVGCWCVDGSYYYDVYCKLILLCGQCEFDGCLMLCEVLLFVLNVDVLVVLVVLLL